MSTSVFYVPCFICAALAGIGGQYGLAVIGLIVGLLWLREEENYD